METKKKRLVYLDYIRALSIFIIIKYFSEKWKYCKEKCV